MPKTNLLSVILYGVGAKARSALKHVRSQGYDPVCFCDTDADKQGKSAFGLKIVSLGDAVKEFGYISIFVTPNPPVKFQIIDFILKFGIRQEQILNYEPTELITSCAELQNNIVIGNGVYYYCCALGNLRNPPPQIETQGDIVADVRHILQKKKALITELKLPHSKLCKGCPQRREDWYSTIPLIQKIAFSISYPCNLRCTYCDVWKIPITLSAEQKRWQNDFKFDEFLRELVKAKALAQNCAVDISAGEITINPRCNEIINTVEELGLGGAIFSNCLVYSERIGSLITNNNWFLLESLDAGTRETYAKLKGKDAFDTVVENINRYAANNGHIQLKYIVTLKNSNENDLNGFLRICDKVTPQKIRLSCDIKNDFNNLPEQLVDFAIRLGQEAIKRGHEVLVLEHFSAKNDKHIQQQIFGC